MAEVSVGPITDGGGNFEVLNETGENVLDLIFIIPTENFFQTFTAKSDLYTLASISFNFDTEDTIVTFIAGNGPDADTTVPPPVTSCGEECSPGFGPNGAFVTVEAFLGSGDDLNHPGLANGQEGTLGLVTGVPEPGTWVLFASALGLLAGGRKLVRRARA